MYNKIKIKKEHLVNIKNTQPSKTYWFLKEQGLEHEVQLDQLRKTLGNSMYPAWHLKYQWLKYEKKFMQ